MSKNTKKSSGTKTTSKPAKREKKPMADHQTAAAPVAPLDGAPMGLNHLLGDGQLGGGAGEGGMPRGRLEGTQGIERRQAPAHAPNP
jgi:hypothetical protein